MCVILRTLTHSSRALLGSSEESVVLVHVVAKSGLV